MKTNTANAGDKETIQIKIDLNKEIYQDSYRGKAMLEIEREIKQMKSVVETFKTNLISGMKNNDGIYISEASFYLSESLGCLNVLETIKHLIANGNKKSFINEHLLIVSCNAFEGRNQARDRKATWQGHVKACAIGSFLLQRYPNL